MFYVTTGDAENSANAQNPNVLRENLTVEQGWVDPGRQSHPRLRGLVARTPQRAGHRVAPRHRCPVRDRARAVESVPRLLQRRGEPHRARRKLRMADRARGAW